MATPSAEHLLEAAGDEKTLSQIGQDKFYSSLEKAFEYKSKDSGWQNEQSKEKLKLRR